MNLTSVKPHIVPAIYNWLSENDAKVFIHFLIDAKDVVISPPPPPHTVVKLKAQRSDNIDVELLSLVLNTNPQAVSHFVMNDQSFYFQCRMNGKVHVINIPYESVIRLECPTTGLFHEFGLDASCLQTETTAETKVVDSSAAPVQHDKPKPSHLTRIK